MEIINIEENKNNIVKKANELIKAKGELSQTAQKMLAMLISMIRADDTEFQSYALKISDYKKEIESTSNKSKNDYIDNARELMSNPFIIDKQMFNWCSKVDWGSLDGYIIFQIHQDLKPYLLQLKGNFTEYNITNIMKLRGKYSPRLYEYFKMVWNEYKAYNKDKKSYTFELKIDWLKGFLKITKGYRYDNIKKQIIEKAKKDFKEFTDIQFTYKEQKIGRKVDRLIITIKDNNKGSADHFSTLQKFVSWARKEYMPDPTNNRFPKLFEYPGVKIGVDLEGRLYIAVNGIPETPDKHKAKIVWELLYRYHKKEIDDAEVLHTIFYQEEQQQQIEENTQTVKQIESVTTKQEEVCDNKTALKNEMKNNLYQDGHNRASVRPTSKSDTL